MSRSMRRIAGVTLSIVAFLGVWLTAQQSLAGSTYRTDPRNARSAPDPDDTARGRITTADGVVVAEDDAEGNRVYPTGETYFHLVGISEDETGSIEGTRHGDLRTRDDGSLTAWLVTLFGGDVGPPDVRLTLVDRIQRVAVSELEGHTGAVVAMDPRTGAVLAYASSPTTDPNEVTGGGLFLPDDVALDRVTVRLLPPGSTFKVLMAAAALEQGFTPESVFADNSQYLAPGAQVPITNVSGGRCTGTDQITLREAVTVSCNTVFAALAVELGGEVVNGIAERAGFNSRVPFELGTAESSLPSAEDLDADLGALAQTGIGERDTRVTPLQMAVLTAALGNDGVMMKPYVVERIVSRDGTTLDRTPPESLGRLVEPDIATSVVSMMIDVVTDGTGRAADIGTVTVAGKTGTAEGGDGPHSWFVALAPAENPTIAVVVVVEGEGTGGTTAAPIAAEVLRAFFQ